MIQTAHGVERGVLIARQQYARDLRRQARVTRRRVLYVV